MSKLKIFTVALIASGILFSNSISAQEEESTSPFDAGLDIYSSYIWRGAKFGTGPAFQPWVEGSFGNFAVGAWGSVNAGAEEAMEMDLYLGYSFDFGLSLTVTDYYFGGDWMDFEKMHYIEPMIGYEFGKIGLSAAFMFNPASDSTEYGAGTPSSITMNGNTGIITPEAGPSLYEEEGSFGSSIDMYFEASYAFNDNLSLTIGAGNGVYTDDGDDTFLMSDDELNYIDDAGAIVTISDDKVLDEKGDFIEDGSFMICNVTLSASKEIAITDKFSLPLSGAVTLNPATGGFFIAVGVSF